MLASKAVEKADKLNDEINSLLEPINIKLENLLGDKHPCSVFLQTDGWCVMFGDETDDAQNAPLSLFDIDELLKMDKKEALKLLQKCSI